MFIKLCFAWLRQRRWEQKTITTVTRAKRWKQLQGRTSYPVDYIPMQRTQAYPANLFSYIILGITLPFCYLIFEVCHHSIGRSLLAFRIIPLISRIGFSTFLLSQVFSDSFFGLFATSFLLQFFKSQECRFSNHIQYWSISLVFLSSKLGIFY